MKLPRPEILNKPFTTKEEYLAWRTAWRAHYKELSETIRLLRGLRRTPLRIWQPEEKFKESVNNLLPLQKDSFLAQFKVDALKLLEQFKYSVMTVYHKVGKDGSVDPVSTGLPPVTVSNYYWPGYDTLKHNLRVEAKNLMIMRTTSKNEAEYQYLRLKLAKADRDKALARTTEMS